MKYTIVRRYNDSEHSIFEFCDDICAALSATSIYLGDLSCISCEIWDGENLILDYTRE